MSSSRTGTSRRSIVVAIVATAAVLVGATVAATTVAMAGGIPLTAGPTASSSPSPSPSATRTASPAPLTPAEQLLADAGDATACAVSFAGDGIAEPPRLETQGALFVDLPIPARIGSVFAGWYATPGDAAARQTAGRINGADAVDCVDQQATLYGAWMSPDENAATATRVPILMYHQFTTKPEGESSWLRGNYAYIGDFEQHMEHIATTSFYLPTWDELSAFIDGRLYLPQRSVIVTDDDCDISWLQLGIPIVVEKKVLSTAFCITIDGTGPSPSPYVQQRSHTHDMHRAGADGKGRIVSLPVPEIVADMQASAAVLGVKQVMAYPFGHYNDTAKEGLREAGWEMARTIDPGYVTIGTDKLALPAVRINYGMGVDALISLIG